MTSNERLRESSAVSVARRLVEAVDLSSDGYSSMLDAACGEPEPTPHSAREWSALVADARAVIADDVPVVTDRERVLEDVAESTAYELRQWADAIRRGATIPRATYLQFEAYADAIDAALADGREGE